MSWGILVFVDHKADPHYQLALQGSRIMLYIFVSTSNTVLLYHMVACEDWWKCFLSLGKCLCSPHNFPLCKFGTVN